jgi:hypothetical protein
MANNKTGFNYYNVDTDRYLDIRIKRLKKAFSCAGISVYDYLLCEIYRVEGCYMEWDENTAFDVSEYFGITESLVNEVVNYCGIVGLFYMEILDNKKIITSLSIQRRATEMSKRSKRNDFKIPDVIKIPEESDIIPEESDIIPEESDIIPSRGRAVGSKVKEGKEGKEIAGAKNSPTTNLHNQISTKNNSMMSFEETKTEFHNSHQWQEKICMDHHLNKDFLISDMDKFLDRLNNQNQFPRKLSDTKAYYFSRLEKYLKSESDKKTAPKAYNGFYEDCPKID